MKFFNDSDSFGDTPETDGWALWRKAGLYEDLHKYVCFFTSGGGSIEGSNEGGSFYFSQEQMCGHDHDEYRHPERLNLAELNFMGKDENGEIVIGKHPECHYADRNPNFVFIQIAQAVVAKRNTNLINLYACGPANIDPKFYEMVSEEVGEMPVQIASEYNEDYL